MVVGFLEQTLFRNVFHLVVLRGVALKGSALGFYLHDKGGRNGLVLGQDIANVARIGAFSASAAAHGGGLDEPGGKFTLCRGASHREFSTGLGGNGKFCARRHVDCVRGSVFKNALAPPNLIPLKGAGLSRNLPA